jgi:hypothetical protein
MKVILEQNQELVHSFVLGETIDPLAKDLVKTLLNTCTSYSGVSLSIQQLCAECLGVLGAIDPSRLMENSQQANAEKMYREAIMDQERYVQARTPG